MKRKVLVPGLCLCLVFIGLGLVFSPGAIVSPATGQAIGYFQGLGHLPGTSYSEAWDLSADGTTVVGNSNISWGEGYAFHWTEATGMVLLPSLPGTAGGSGGDGVSANGSKAAGCSSSQFGTREACRWTQIDGNWVPEGLGDLPGGAYESVGFGMSSDGNVIVGRATSDKGSEACRWTFVGSVWVPQGLGDLPGGSYRSEAYGCSADGSVVVGQSSIFKGSRAFRWTAATGMVDLGVVTRKKWSAAWGCSADGSVVVGESFTNHGKDEVAFRWTAATGMVGLGDLPGGTSYSEADAVSPDGSIVVGGSMTAKGVEAFIWDATNGMRHLMNYLVAKGLYVPAGWTLQWANGVTVNTVTGVVTIVGKGINPDKNTEAWIAVVPVL